MSNVDELRLSVVAPFHDNPGRLELSPAALEASSIESELICVDLESVLATRLR